MWFQMRRRARRDTKLVMRPLSRWTNQPIWSHQNRLSARLPSPEIRDGAMPVDCAGAAHPVRQEDGSMMRGDAVPAGDEHAIRNALTFDVEEHFQVHNLARVVRRSDWDRHPSRVESNTRRILRLLDDHRSRATFFVLGWVADRYPKLVEDIARAGHEVASHGYWHQLVYEQTPSDFERDLEAAHKAILDALGVCPSTRGERRLGYRAPSFSITPRSWWALEILENQGYRYDSSVSPTAVNRRYRNEGAPRFACRIRRDLWEFPVSTLSVFGHNLPVAGGGYFRLAPLRLTRSAIRHLNHQHHPAVVYLHPWEFDPGQPRVERLSASASFRHYVNLRRTEPRLRKLLEEFAFGPVCEVFRGCIAGSSESTEPTLQ